MSNSGQVLGVIAMAVFGVTAVASLLTGDKQLLLVSVALFLAGFAAIVIGRAESRRTARYDRIDRGVGRRWIDTDGKARRR